MNHRVFDQSKLNLSNEKSMDLKLNMEKEKETAKWREEKT